MKKNYGKKSYIKNKNYTLPFQGVIGNKQTETWEVNAFNLNICKYICSRCGSMFFYNCLTYREVKHICSIRTKGGKKANNVLLFENI